MKNLLMTTSCETIRRSNIYIKLYTEKKNHIVCGQSEYD